MSVFKKARERSKLTLDDVRFLLNLKSWGSLSRIEAGKRPVTKEVAVGYHVLFGIPFEDIFKTEIDQHIPFLGEYAQSRIEDMQSRKNGIDHVERIVTLEQIRDDAEY